MFVLKADTPEATRDVIVKWLNSMASNHRIAAARMSGIHKREVELAKAGSYQEAADFLGNAKVESSLPVEAMLEKVKQLNVAHTFTCRAPDGDRNPCAKQCNSCLAMEETGP